MIKKFLLSVSVIVAFIFYAVYQKLPSINLPQETPSVTQVPMANISGFKDGSFTGDAADALYGNVQVKAVISGGRITDVQFLQYPNDRQRSVAINSQAMPILKQEAIQAQSAQVDTVTGASQTSAAFKQSLQSALNQAKS